MSHFNQDFIDFFSDLTKKNNREWFKENKQRYELSVKKPFEAFIEEMINRIGDEEDDIRITPKEAIFRIYRDVRFSKDKSPYKTHASAVISPKGRKDFSVPGWYIQLSAEDARFYSGMYEMEKDSLQKLREHIAGNLKEFESLLKEKDFKKYFGTIHGEQHKRLPKEFQEAAEKQPLIANKQFYYFATFEPTKILSKNFTDLLMKCYYASRNMNNFIKDGLGQY
jgi:uncharacterized protein (TIGR02453 family)